MMDMYLFSCIVHELVVRTAEYFPVARKGGMRDDEVTGRITIGVSYFGVMDTCTIGRGGLDVNKSTTRQMGVQNGIIYHTSTTTS